ncbi:MAG: hypothetical protein KatS3mg088_180 [Patescibacteria group bacterium]|nr:MAG: hypothetical protein KatS3mg088_180 [Patescibacteria group bacterium]
MQGGKKKPNLISTLILTTISIVTWVSFSIYKALVKPEPVVVPPEIIEPITPQLDDTILKKMTERYYIPEEELPETITNPKAQFNQISQDQKPTPSPTTEEILPTIPPNETYSE